MQWCSVLFCWVIGLVFSIPHAVLSRLIGTPHICEIYFETDAQYWWRVSITGRLKYTGKLHCVDEPFKQ